MAKYGASTTWMGKLPNALLPEGLKVLEAWGFSYKSNLIWHKVRKDGGPDGRGVGFYFRNTTEIILFGVRGKNARTLDPGRSQVNIIRTMKREHSRKPDEQYDIIEACSPGPYLELFGRGSREGWTTCVDGGLNPLKSGGFELFSDFHRGVIPYRPAVAQRETRCTDTDGRSFLVWR